MQYVKQVGVTLNSPNISSRFNDQFVDWHNE